MPVQSLLVQAVKDADLVLVTKARKDKDEKNMALSCR